VQVEILLTRLVDLTHLGAINAPGIYINWKESLDKTLEGRSELSTTKLYAVKCEYLYCSDRAKTRVRSKTVKYLFKINLFDSTGSRYIVKSQFPDVLSFPKENQ